MPSSDRKEWKREVDGRSEQQISSDGERPRQAFFCLSEQLASIVQEIARKCASLSEGRHIWRYSTSDELLLSVRFS